MEVVAILRCMILFRNTYSFDTSVTSRTEVEAPGQYYGKFHGNFQEFFEYNRAANTCQLFRLMGRNGVAGLLRKPFNWDNPFHKY